MSLYQEFRRIYDVKQVDTLILFVTAACNFRCGFCCYANNLNQGGDMPFEAIEKISKSLDPFRSLMISGGEPALRKTLAEVMLLFVRNNNTRVVAVPTNGWYTDKLVRHVSAFCDQESEAVLTISISLDGVGEVNDKVRGMEGGFERAIETFEALGALKGKYPNFRLKSNSVVTHGNTASIETLLHFIHDHHPEVDEHTIEIERDISVAVADYSAYRDLTDDFARLSELTAQLFDVQKGKRTRRSQDIPPFLSRFATPRVNRVATQVKIDRIHGKKWSYPCTAGRTMIVINNKGQLALCELREEYVNLADYNFDVGAAMQSEYYQKALAQIPKDRCDCTHGCFVSDSLSHSGNFFMLNVPTAKPSARAGKKSNDPRASSPQRQTTAPPSSPTS